MTKQLQQGKNRPRLNFWEIFIILFVLTIGLGEGFSRLAAKHFPSLINHNPLSDSGYSAAVNQFDQIQAFVHEYGSPDCIFIGNSLVQTGIDPLTFSIAFNNETGKSMTCYNNGMDSSTLSSTVPMAMIIAGLYKPSYFILGIQGFSFHQNCDSKHLAECNFQYDHSVRYLLGKPDPIGWAEIYSPLYRLLKNTASWLFSEQSISPGLPNTTITIHPEVPRTINYAGYGPLPGYRDPSPIFQDSMTQTQNVDFTIDSQDLKALHQFIAFTQERGIHLILIEMPVNDSNIFLGTNDQIMEDVRQRGVPYLLTDRLSPLPPASFSDQNHMQISGSMLFSQWLGAQLGKAIEQGALADTDSSIWSPVIAKWPKPVYLSTLGLSETGFHDYLVSNSTFNLLPEDAVIFNPDARGFDQQFLQSLVGFNIEWKAKVSEQEREDLFQFMTVLGRMKYQHDLSLSQAQADQLGQWHTNLDTSILNDLGIQYVLCRVELANLSAKHCPTGVENDRRYLSIASWNFDPMYEKYYLYQVNTDK